MATRAAYREQPWRARRRALCKLFAVLWVLPVAPGCGDVTVTAVDVATVIVTPSEEALFPGETRQFTASLQDEEGNLLSGRDVHWSSDDESVATVSDAGLLESRASGTTQIKASAAGAEGTAAVTVLMARRIALSRKTIHVAGTAGGSPVDLEPIGVSNEGDGTLAGLEVTVSYGTGPGGWLDATLSSKEAPADLHLRAIPGDLAPGDHVAEVRVSAPSAENSPQKVEVRFDVEPADRNDPDESPDEEPEDGPDDGPEGPPGNEPSDDDDSGEAPEDASCNLADRTVRDDVDIRAGDSCAFSNVRVEGNLRIEAGATLVATGIELDGNLEARSARRLVLSDSEVEGNLRFDGGGDLDVSAASIDGNVTYRSSQGRLAFEENTVDGNVRVQGNSGGPFRLSGNAIDGNLQCDGNDPSPTGGGNAVEGNQQGQCRDL